MRAPRQGTARDFATRVVGEVQVHHLVAMRVKGFDDPGWNSSYTRQPYVNDNQPVFRWPVQRPNRVPVCAARTLNVTGKSRVTLSLR